MRAVRWLGLVSCVLAFVPLAHGDQVPVGLPWKQIFIQEYWHNGKPHFSIANIGKADVVVSTGAPDGPWNVKAGAIVQVPTKPGKATELLTVSTAAGRLGRLQSPTAPLERAKKPYVVHYGLNGSGGRFNVYYMQQDWTFPSEGTIEIDLVIPANRGMVTFWKTAQHDYPLTQIFVDEAKCDGLTVTDDGKSIVLDATKALKPEKNHVVRLKLKAPKVAAPTLVLMDGWMDLADKDGKIVPFSNGGGVARGVIVVPAEEENPFKKANIGDWAEFKLTGSSGEGKTKMTVVAKDDKELTYEVATTYSVGGKEKTVPVQKVKIDLTKPYDPAGANVLSLGRLTRASPATLDAHIFSVPGRRVN
jgi:hypothetical protein